MKYLLIILEIAFCIFLAQCAAKKKVEYEIPPHYVKEQREKAIEAFEKGKVLFKINCAECHGIYKDGKENIPNFTKTQIDGYNAMYIKGDPRNHSVARKLSPDQLGSILTFLRLRKMDK
ncbi:MAG: c-type cytochrome [Bacteroidetes bacterium]|nr:c-type cytochrome [Bacteroidota bacterium]MBS1933228.1 c-type cytochrome [Bacteroidota bacterium]